MDHLVYVDSEAKELERLLAGHKTIILRGSHEPVAPYNKIFEGDSLFLITTKREGVVQAKALVKNVLNPQKLEVKDSIELINRYLMEMMLTEEQLNRYYGKPYLTFVRVMEVQRIQPFTIDDHAARGFTDWFITENINKIKSQILM
jgi:hypothetical protein